MTTLQNQSICTKKSNSKHPQTASHNTKDSEEKSFPQRRHHRKKKTRRFLSKIRWVVQLNQISVRLGAFLQMSRKNTNSKADRKAGVTPLPNPPKFSTERRQGQKLQIAPPRSHTRRYNFSLQLFLEEANLPKASPAHRALPWTLEKKRKAPLVCRH